MMAYTSIEGAFLKVGLQYEGERVASTVFMKYATLFTRTGIVDSNFFFTLNSIVLFVFLDSVVFSS